MVTLFSISGGLRLFGIFCIFVSTLFCAYFPNALAYAHTFSDQKSSSVLPTSKGSADSSTFFAAPMLSAVVSGPIILVQPRFIEAQQELPDPSRKSVVPLFQSSSVPAVGVPLGWLERAREVARQNFRDDVDLVATVLDGQNLLLMKAIQEMMDRFALIQDLNFSQDLQLEPVDIQQMIAEPILIYRGEKPFRPRSSDLADFDRMLATILNVISKTQLPEPFASQTDLKIRFENALRKMHIENLLTAAIDGGASNDLISFLTELQHSADVARQKNAGRIRPELDVQDRRAVSAFLGGFLWRFRGAGGYDDFGTQERRELFVRQGFAALARFNGAPSSRADAIASALRFGVQTTSWGKYHDMGRLPGDDKYSDFRQMERLGRNMVSGTRQSLGSAGYSKAALISQTGASLASCYYDSWERIPLSLRVGANFPKPYLFIFGGPTNWGEFCMGASLGLALAEILNP